MPSILLALPVIALTLLVGCSRGELQPWHTLELQEEYSQASADEVETFADYLLLEERLFLEVDREIYGHSQTGPEQRLNRYSPGSAADYRAHKPYWNRSFELIPDAATGGVLLLHGMSDSPYSLRALGQALHRSGYRVLGLRLPGHGTIPAGLKHLRWQEMASSVHLAANHLAQQLGDKPLHIIGYSTGAALAVDYALDAGESTTVAMPASLVLVSPAIGVSPLAALARWKRRLALLPGLGHFAWSGMEPEFDPYKYNSFATNAAEQVHLLTRHLARRIATLGEAGAGDSLPPILVLKSTIDATVTTDAVVDRLLMHLAPGRHEMVLFDINREAMISPLLVADPGPLTLRLLEARQLPFTLTLVSNSSKSSSAVVARTRPPMSGEFDRQRTLGMEWPRGVLSLSHVAVPFPPDDPLYGRFPPQDSNQLFLGQIPVQGERGLLKLSSNWLLRLRYNPFYDYLEARTLDWLDEQALAAPGH